jgi:hypothetical protein
MGVACLSKWGGKGNLKFILSFIRAKYRFVGYLTRLFDFAKKFN